jgi:hypothetical protein
MTKMLVDAPCYPSVYAQHANRKNISTKKRNAPPLCFLRKYEVFPLHLFSFFLISRTLLVRGSFFLGPAVLCRRVWRRTAG